MTKTKTTASNQTKEENPADFPRDPRESETGGAPPGGSGKNGGRTRDFLFEERIFRPSERRRSPDSAGVAGDSIAVGGSYPLPEVVRRCWPKLFPTESSAKKSVRKGIFWVRDGPREREESAGQPPRDDANRGASRDGDGEAKAEAKTKTKTKHPFRKGKCGTRVRPGDPVRRKLPPPEPHYRARGRSTSEVLERSIGGKLRVAYMDRSLAVVVKPQGMIVGKLGDSSTDARKAGAGDATPNRADEDDNGNDNLASGGERNGVGMHELLLHCLPPLPAVRASSLGGETESDALRRPAAVHRLDQPTHGLLIVARTGSAARFLGRAFRERDDSLIKRYRAVVHGHPEGNAHGGGTGFVRSPLSGKECCSEYRIVRRWVTGGDVDIGDVDIGNDDDDDDPSAIGSRRGNEKRNRADGVPLALVDLYPHTGRKHQLRRHMASIGHPIVGDTRYGSDGSSREADRRLSRYLSGVGKRKTPPAAVPRGPDEESPSRSRSRLQSRSGPTPVPLMLAAVEVVFPHPESIRDETGIAPGPNENWIPAGDAEHSFDASNGTLRVEIGMPEAMKRIVSRG